MASADKLQWKIFCSIILQLETHKIQGVLFWILGFQLAIALKRCIIDPLLLKPKWVWELAEFFNFVKYVYNISNRLPTLRLDAKLEITTVDIWIEVRNTIFYESNGDIFHEVGNEVEVNVCDGIWLYDRDCSLTGRWFSIKILVNNATFRSCIHLISKNLKQNKLYMNWPTFGYKNC